MTKTELQTMYEVMFTDYPDIVNIAQVQSMLKISRHLAYELIGDGYIYPRHENRKRLPHSENQRDPLRSLGGQSPAGSVTRI